MDRHTIPTVDKDGTTLLYRWVTRGGIQIEGRVFTQHALRVSLAARISRSMEVSTGRYTFAEPKPEAKPMVFPIHLKRASA